MVTLTQAQVLKAVPNINRERLNQLVASWNMWACHFKVDTPARACHFLAQIFTETGALAYMSENLNYSADGLLTTFPKYFNQSNAGAYARNSQKIANRVYANRMGNGSEGSGDGYRYRGRGCLMLTGKDNYTAFNRCDCCTEDVVRFPDKVANYYLNMVSALWFWEKNKLNELADKDNGTNGEDIVRQITKRVNGGTNGLAQRKAYYKKFREVIK